MPPEILEVDGELELVRVAPLDGQMYADMLREDEPELNFVDIQGATDECFGMYNDMVDGRGLSYWVDRRGMKVGYVGLTHVQQTAFGEDYWAMDYWMLAAARGQHIMSRAARSLLHHGFAANTFSEVHLHIVTSNVASQKVARNIGATVIPELSNGEAERWKVTSYA